MLKKWPLSPTNVEEVGFRVNLTGGKGGLEKEQREYIDVSVGVC